MIQVNRIYLIFNRLVTKKFLVDTSVLIMIMTIRQGRVGLLKKPVPVTFITMVV